MAYGRRYTRRRRSTRRPRKMGRVNRSTRRLATRALRTAKKVSKILRRNINEFHQGDTILMNTSNPSMHLLNNIENGPGEEQHVGDEYECTSVVLTVDAGITAEPDTPYWYRRARCILFNVKSSVSGSLSAQIPSWDLLLETTKSSAAGGSSATYWSIYDADKCGYNRKNVPNNIEILFDQIIKIDQDNPQKQVRRRIPYRRTMRNTDFTGASDYMFQNLLVWCMIPLDSIYTPATGQLQLGWASRLFYYE